MLLNLHAKVRKLSLRIGGGVIALRKGFLEAAPIDQQKMWGKEIEGMGPS